MKVLRTGWLLIVFALLSCASSPDQSRTPAPASPAPEQRFVLDEVMRDLTPRAGQPLFLGVSPPLHDREAEMARAVLHVAEQASRYTRMFAQYQFVTRRGGGTFGYLDNIQADWDATYADSLIDSVRVLQAGQDNMGTYVIATVEGIPPAPPVELGDIHGPGEPAWVSRPPEIPGFIVTVGATRRSRRIRDSIDTADEDALKEILLQTRSTVRMIEDRRDIDRVGTVETTTAAQNAEATLRQFLVLARYSPPDGRYYYSLVAAREE